MRYNIYKMKKLLTVYKYFILLFPLAMFFSFRPWISLGTNETMNFEISLTMIWLVLFDVLSFFVLIFTKRLFELRKYWKWLLLPLYFAISIIWSHDRLRAVLIFGVLLCIYFAIFGIFALKDKIFRIGTLGFVSERDIIMAVGALEATLYKLGYNFELGKGVAAVIRELKD